MNLYGVSPPYDEVLLFRQKDPKPFLPVRGPSDIAEKQFLRGPWSSTPNQDGSETRCAQTVFAREVGFGVPAQPRPTQVLIEDKTEPRIKLNEEKVNVGRKTSATNLYIFLKFWHPRFWMRRRRSPESTFRRELFERSEFSRHLIRDGGGGTPLGPQTGGNGFASFCRNKRRSPAGAKPCLNHSLIQQIRTEVFSSVTKATLDD